MRRYATGKLLQLRRAVPADAAAIEAVRRVAILGARRGGYDLGELANWARRPNPAAMAGLISRGARVALAVERGRVLGFVHWRPGFIEGLYVDPGTKGLGRMLLARALDEMPPGEVRLEASLPAVGFYKHVGFEEVSRHARCSRVGRNLEAIDMVISAEARR